MDTIYAQGSANSDVQVAKMYNPNGWFFKKMNNFNSKLGVKLLGLYLKGMVGIGTTKPPQEPLNPKVDKGVLLRIPMDVFQTALQNAGFRVVSIPLADVYQTQMCATVMPVTPLSRCIRLWKT